MTSFTGVNYYGPCCPCFLDYTSPDPPFALHPLAPDIFRSIGLVGTRTGLLSSGIYGIVKIVATTAFILLGIEKIGRRYALMFGALGMSLFLW